MYPVSPGISIGSMVYDLYIPFDFIDTLSTPPLTTNSSPISLIS